MLLAEPKRAQNSRLSGINLEQIARQAARRLPEFLLTSPVYLGDMSCLLNSARLASLF